MLRVQTKGIDFSLDGEEFKARVVDVYDGDTIRVVFNRKGELQQHRVRMLDYDSAELRGKNRSDEEKVAAIRAKNALAELIHNEGQLVKLKCSKFDNFGRLLGTVYLEDGTNVNQWMLQNHHGVSYQGGKKLPFVPN